MPFAGMAHRIDAAHIDPLGIRPDLERPRQTQPPVEWRRHHARVRQVDRPVDPLHVTLVLDVVPLGRGDRQPRARVLGEATRPDAGGEHDLIARDRSTRRLDADRLRAPIDTRYLDTLDDPRACVARAGCDPLDEPERVDVPVLGTERPGLHPLHVGNQSGDTVGVQLDHLKAGLTALLDDRGPSPLRSLAAPDVESAVLDEARSGLVTPAPVQLEAAPRQLLEIGRPLVGRTSTQR